ncbi:MAG: formylglycine-generating enzyme family protein [Spirochaetales bacterium]|nr:formylglycine-generating enzyme family protein [Spirochaetales bacterium]
MMKMLSRGKFSLFLTFFCALTWNMGAQETLPMVKVSGGDFAMSGKIGTTVSAFSLGKTPVTQAQFQKVMGFNPSHFKGATLPVENVSWYDAVIFCNKLSELEELTPAYVLNGRTVTWNRQANGYRLPTEAEYEFAARGGTLTQKTLFPGSNAPDEVAWYKDNSKNTTHPVGTKKPNELGLSDMSGNVWEWCWDWYSETLAGGNDPAGPRLGSLRVLKGGSWETPVTYLNLNNRSNAFPWDQDASIGFRVARWETPPVLPAPAKAPTTEPPSAKPAPAAHP